MRLSPIITVLSAAALFPAAASASQVSSDGSASTPVFKSGKAASNVDVRDARGGTLFMDSAQPLFVGPGCTTGAPVFCTGYGVDARLSPQADRFIYKGSFPSTVVAGDGNDSVYSGGLANDVKAGAGDDDVWANGGTVTVTGGPGDDRLYGTETGTDLAGGDGNDLVFGDSNAGGDTIAGNDGDDTLVGGHGFLGGGGDARGGPGNDVIVVQGFPWTIEAGPGDDLVRGGPAEDVITTGDGSDTVDALDNVPDSINCGAGADVVYADPFDKVARNCESVLGGPVPAMPAIDDALARANAFKAALPLS